MSFWSKAAALAITGALAGAAGAWGGALIAERRLEGALATRPAIAVVDYAPVETALRAGAFPAQLEAPFRELKRRVAALEQAGFLVINRAMTDAAPPEILVPLEGITFPEASPQGRSASRETREGAVARVPPDDARAVIERLTGQPGRRGVAP